ncbi:cadherin EGF LAG seven-pass G-type receptor 2-like [Saccostrea echinata]|uniref:cadherin EGF LAG seven-pass G-type receptor 2-like n=1 Tax=Saccostrea echinata TaxID=191078 RepID=UPI002A7ECEBC|nr:cadherin EGF LAG seven-pass G-type receptor 2-like [Saccostrea echinata]
MTFGEIVSRFEQLFGKGTLQIASQVEFNSMTQQAEESLEQWSDRVMETVQRSLGARVPGQVLQEQAVLWFAMGCQDARAGQASVDDGQVNASNAFSLGISVVSVQKDSSLSPQLLQMKVMSDGVLCSRSSGRIHVNVGAFANTEADSPEELGFVLNYLSTKLFSITAQDRNGGTVTVIATGETSDLVTIKHTQSGTWGVFLKKNLDRETHSQHLLRFIAASVEKDAPSSALEVTLFVNDVNDVAPKFSQPAYHIQVPEDHDLAVPINISISATDPDNGPGGSVSYDMEASALYGKTFIINPLNGQVTLNQHLDYERLTFYQYKLIAKDGGNPSLTSTADLLITILDVQDTPPIFQGLPYMTTIKENHSVGTTIFRVLAVDGDTGIPNNITYSFSSGIEKSHNLNFSKSLLNINASEVIGKPTNLTETVKPFTITIEDVNDNIPIFNQSTYYGSVKENVTDIPITISGDGLYVKDIDQMGSNDIKLHVYTNDSNIQFNDIVASPSLVSSEGTFLLRLTNNFTFDYEKHSIIDLIIKAEDKKDSSMFSVCTVHVTINDTNDNDPIFKNTLENFTLPENSSFNTTVTEIKATDADSGKYSEITYHLQGSNSINSKTGEISVACNNSCLDRERQIVYQMSVEARDGGGKVSSAPVKITLMDVNDNSPMFLQPKYEFGITENSSLISGMNNFTVHAVDYDEPRTANSLITYTLLPRPDTLDRHFTINSTTGSIRIVNPLTRDQLSLIPNGRLELEVTAHDNGSPSLTSTVSITAFLQAQLQSSTSSNCNISSTTTSVKPTHYGSTYSANRNLDVTVMLKILLHRDFVICPVKSPKIEINLQNFGVEF